MPHPRGLIERSAGNQANALDEHIGIAKELASAVALAVVAVIISGEQGAPRHDDTLRCDMRGRSIGIPSSHLIDAECDNYASLPSANRRTAYLVQCVRNA